mmetsp:Transcript_28237/g.79703  ORF Transcript_28237/g.79703 Transcript_28237/m.79703 type:complete len:211 (+) Transcript_28237:1076-1708(+)
MRHLLHSVPPPQQSPLFSILGKYLQVCGKQGGHSKLLHEVRGTNCLATVNMNWAEEPAQLLLASRHLVFRIQSCCASNNGCLLPIGCHVERESALALRLVEYEIHHLKLDHNLVHLDCQLLADRMLYFSILQLLTRASEHPIARDGICGLRGAAEERNGRDCAHGSPREVHKLALHTVAASHSCSVGDASGRIEGPSCCPETTPRDCSEY